MKSIIIIGLLSFSSVFSAIAQGGNTYQDDIYYTGADARKDAREKAKKQKNNTQQSSANEENYDQNGNYYNDQYGDNNGNSNNSSYIDYDDDDYTYSSYFNRFGNRGFYNRPYFSAFNNPYWYNPQWVDPYWGWSPWYRPGTVSYTHLDVYKRQVHYHLLFYVL